MSKSRFLLVYPDGSRRHIDRETRDSLLLSLSARETAPGRYFYTAQAKTYHSFQDLGRDLVLARDLGTLRRFISGNFIFELNGKKQRELMETPEGMAARLVKMGSQLEHAI